MSLIRVEFEVFGKVQGVFFRKYTKKKSDELSLKGWCMNTDKKTVIGIIEGERPKIEAMKIWLRKNGSPESRIDKTVFSSEVSIEKPSFASFEIRR